MLISSFENIFSFVSNDEFNKKLLVWLALMMILEVSPKLLEMYVNSLLESSEMQLWYSEMILSVYGSSCLGFVLMM
jgi:hypothetical protein